MKFQSPKTRDCYQVVDMFMQYSCHGHVYVPLIFRLYKCLCGLLLPFPHVTYSDQTYVLLYYMLTFFNFDKQTQLLPINLFTSEQLLWYLLRWLLSSSHIFAMLIFRWINVIYLLHRKQKAKLEVKDRHYKTPLFYAKANGMKDIIEILIKAGTMVLKTIQKVSMILHHNLLQ